MPVTHQVESGGVRIVVRGDPKEEELLRGFQLALDDPELPPGARLLVDVTGSRTPQPNHVMLALGHLFAGAKDRLGGRIAVVVAHEVRYGLARQLGARLDEYGLHVRPFRQPDEAVAWLYEDRRDGEAG